MSRRVEYEWPVSSQMVNEATSQHVCVSLMPLKCERSDANQVRSRFAPTVNCISQFGGELASMSYNRPVKSLPAGQQRDTCAKEPVRLWSCLRVIDSCVSQ